MKVVIDTNVFISGIFWSGGSHDVILAWKGKKFKLVSSLDTVAELMEVLKDFKIQLPEDLVSGWFELIIRNSIIVDPKERFNFVKDDPKDNMFVDAAIAGKVNYIISQDKHLLKLKEIKGIKIVTPEGFLRLG